MTLFELIDPQDPVFGQVLDALCSGRRDEATLELISSAARSA